MMITLIVTYCMILNPTMCRELEIIPVDRAIVSIPECIRGGAMGDVLRFTLDHAEWRTKGWRCVESKTLMAEWAKSRP
jgi:hypothetical protein